ncbi:hypothetical protein [Lihuaxuella thermophila]|uniref:Uncharacterized protein n=1 Tax=Lihuaxuella thermophila TaxID=1173111 RepID=A0A1H8CWY4_9BACL|nr:hypothetical protein [Lihuaxuella thermophila]SEM99510.1 hypothetical protein SAMN05444955_104161 [Lihuaxuella thermophila]
MLRLTVEGPEEKVRDFLKDFSNLPQHKVITTSELFFNGGTEDATVICHFFHYPLEEINEPISVLFRTTDGKYLGFTLLKGNVIRIGNEITISGKATSGLLE